MRGIPQSSLGAYTRNAGANKLRGLAQLGDAPLFSLDNGYSVDANTGDVFATPVYPDFPTVSDPGPAPAAVNTASGTSWFDQISSIGSGFVNLFTNVTSATNAADMQARLNQINLQRAAQGLAPYSAQQFAAGTAPVSPGVKMAGFGIAGFLLLAAFKKGGKRSRRR